MIELGIRQGGELDIRTKGVFNPLHEVFLGDEKVAHLYWEKELLTEQAFYTTADARFEIVPRGTCGRSTSTRADMKSWR
jgi:hypothetical protein